MTTSSMPASYVPSFTPRKARWPRVILSTILLYTIATRVVLLNEPFSRNAEGCGCFYGMLARNYLRFPLHDSWGVPVMSTGLPPEAAVRFYGHHPPLLPMLIALTYKVFGQGDWQTRLSTAMFTVACVIAVFTLLKNRGHEIAGLVAAALFAAVPMTVFYGGQPDVINTQLAFFTLLTLSAYQPFHDRPTVRRLLILCLAFLPAGYTDWPAYYVVPVLCGHFAVTKKPKQWAWIVPFGIFSVALFAVAYGQIAVMVKDWHWMSDQLERRTIAGKSDRQEAITWPIWFAGVLRFNVIRHTWPVLILAAAWLVGFGWRIRNSDRAANFVRLAWAFALLHVFVGRQAVFTHEWWWWPLTPALVMSAGLLLERLLARIEAPPRPEENFPNEVKPADSNPPVFDHRALKPYFFRSPLRVSIILLLVAFPIWTTTTTFELIHDPRASRGGVTFTTTEIGDAIRAAATNPNDVVAVAYDDAYDLPLWYYADRPLRLHAWSPYQIGIEPMSDNRVELPFDFHQPAPGPTAAVVMPKEFVDAAPEFVATLRSKYPCTERGKFLTFDLRR